MSEARFSQFVQHQASGQAALMLLEALMLELVEHNILSAESMKDSIQTIIETKRQLIADRVEDEVARCAIGMLITIENTISAVDLGESRGTDTASSSHAMRPDACGK